MYFEIFFFIFTKLKTAKKFKIKAAVLTQFFSFLLFVTLHFYITEKIVPWFIKAIIQTKLIFINKYFSDIDVSKAIVINQHVEKAKEMLPVMKIITAEKIIKKDNELFLQSREIQDTLEKLSKLPITTASNETGIENS